MRRKLLSVCLLFLLSGSPCAQQELGFLEKFSLTQDKARALTHLIPGTSDYYYYHSLYHQSRGEHGKVEELLTRWIKRMGRNSQVIEIENRQALLSYQDHPTRSLDFLRRRLGLQFDHQQERPGARADLPTRVDKSLISRAAFKAQALKKNKNHLEGYLASGLLDLVGEWRSLDKSSRRQLLSRLDRPDLPGLVGLVIADLKRKGSKGFGEHKIHGLLLPGQLQECLRRKPDLIRNTRFVFALLAKVQPTAEEDWQGDLEVRKAYLDRLWYVVKGLDRVFNSLKAHVLYHRLLLDRDMGVYDLPRFMTYLRIPRAVPYMNRKYPGRVKHKDFQANLKASYFSLTLLPAVGNDEPLVRSFLLHFFVKAPDFGEYGAILSDTYLKPLFAEAKILAGVGDMERWFSLLGPAGVQALRQRVDLDFAHNNPKVYAPDDPVSLELFTKNVDMLIVKVFRINTDNFYRKYKHQVTSGINLDGLVANEERVIKLTDSPHRRVRRKFDFPQLGGRGVYVIDFTGNGKTSRALIRKGQYRYLERTSVAGQVLTILDETNQRVPGASVVLDGREYTEDEDGTILIPFTTKPGDRKLILRHQGFASLVPFKHQKEDYSLEVGFHVDRESLLKNRIATVCVRPEFRLNGKRVTMEILEKITLTVTTEDDQKVETKKRVEGFKLFADRESLFRFRVAENLQRIRFSLAAEVESKSAGGAMVKLNGSHTIYLNGINRTETVEDQHLIHVQDRYILEVRGRTGERIGGKVLRLVFNHEDFKDSILITVKTDPMGRIDLGSLKGITVLSNKGKGWQWWGLLEDRCHLPERIHGRVGTPLQMPWMPRGTNVKASGLSLLERRGKTYYADRLEHCSVEGGMLVIRGLGPGDYDLGCKRGARVRIRIVDGDFRDGHFLGRVRHLEASNPSPLQISSIKTDPTNIRIQLANPNPYTRVHVFATHYMPEFYVFRDLNILEWIGPGEKKHGSILSHYLPGRKIGDEFRYIIERKYATKYPGNMLKRPSLLLNPWELRITGTSSGLFDKDQFNEVIGIGGGAGGYRSSTAACMAGGNGKCFSNLDFLSRQSVSLFNLQPDSSGVLIVPRKRLGPHHQIRVVAIDRESTVFREVALPECKATFRDLRLRAALDPKRHFAEQGRVSALVAGNGFVLTDTSTGQLEIYDHLGRVYRLFGTLNPDFRLKEFAFILGWPDYPVEKKRRLYSKYASHELNFFLFKKDPGFFKTVIQPYLAAKKDKTFIDRYLLNQDLTPFLSSWAYSQLNVVERILLSQRISGERPQTVRHLADLQALIPHNVERANFLFNTAIRSGGLEVSDKLGLKAAKRETEKKSKLAKNIELPMEEEPELVESDDLLDEDMAPEAPKADDSKLAKSGRKDSAARSEVGYPGDLQRRKDLRQLYRKLGKTKEWAENNYYKLPRASQNASLIRINGFWVDYARHEGNTPFVSKNFVHAARNFPEMMFALSVLDLPCKPGKHKSEHKEGKLHFTAGGTAVVFHKEIRPAEKSEQKIPILVSQKFFRYGNRNPKVNGEQQDKPVSGEFLTNFVYRCQLVVTNPTSSRQKLDLLLQIPQGAIPVMGSRYTRGIQVDLKPYRTQSLGYYFYFPFVGDFAHFPVHVSKNGLLVAAAGAVTLQAVKELTRIDKTCWDWVSQNGSTNQVIDFMKANNLNRLDLSKIAWRMRDQDAFSRLTRLLAERHLYNSTLWSYGFKHNDPQAVGQYLLHHNDFLRQSGTYLVSPLVVINPVVRKTYEHLEYSPLVNARAHRLSSQTSRILNPDLHRQYHKLLKVLSYKQNLTDVDLMAVTYYLLLQDRITEAKGFFARVDRTKLKTLLQYDYFTAYLDFFNDKPGAARAIADKYKDYPVDRWRKIFAAVGAQLDEFEGKDVSVVDDKDRTQQQTSLAASQPGLELKVVDGKVTLHYMNLDKCRVSYYPIDIELRFSRNPFMKSGLAKTGDFSLIRPNLTERVTLPALKTGTPGKHVLSVPKAIAARNVMVEVTAAGITRSQPCFAGVISAQVIENYGQLKVTHGETGKPLSKVYIKVYARLRSGTVKFYKDGYTDLRGRFDYTSLNPSNLNRVSRFAILILSETGGAIVREANPPR